MQTETQIERRIVTDEDSYEKISYTVDTGDHVAEVWWYTKAGDGSRYPFGGIELHRRKLPSYAKDWHYAACQVTGGNCYHEGSSLAFDPIRDAIVEHGENSTKVQAMIRQVLIDWSVNA